MVYNLSINGVYWGYDPLTNHLLTSWDIQVGGDFVKDVLLNFHPDPEKMMQFDGSFLLPCHRRYKGSVIRKMVHMGLLF